MIRGSSEIEAVIHAIFSVLFVQAFSASAASLIASAHDVSVGGLAGFANLATAANSTAFRASGRARLYLHIDAVTKLDQSGGDATLSQMYSLFHSQGLSTVELGYQPPTVGGGQLGYFTGIYNAVVTKLGGFSDTALVNVNFMTTSVPAANWNTYVDAGKSNQVI